MISVNAALAAIDRAIGPLPPETIALAAAPGRTLAADLAADSDFPPFDTTAMDGYAVAGATLEARERPGTTGAGGTPPPPLRDGEAARVMTGAPIPEGALAVVPVEDAERTGDTVVFRRLPKPGDHLRRRGEIFRAINPHLRRGFSTLARGARRVKPSLLRKHIARVENPCHPSAVMQASGAR